MFVLQWCILRLTSKIDSGSQINVEISVWNLLVIFLIELKMHFVTMFWNFKKLSPFNISNLQILNALSCLIEVLVIIVC